MGTELSVIPKGASLEQLTSYAEVFKRSGLFQDLESVAQCIVKVQAGAELGISPFASVNGLHIIKGKVTLSAGLISTLIKRSGKYNYRVTEHTTEVCTATFFENGEVCGISSFTIEDAKAAGLLANPMWNKYRRNMLFSRMVSNGGKWYCADIFGGPVYTPDEIDNTLQLNEDGEIITAKFTPVPVVQAAAVNQDDCTITQVQFDKICKRRDEALLPRPDPHEMSEWTQGEAKAYFRNGANFIPAPVEAEPMTLEIPPETELEKLNIVRHKINKLCMSIKVDTPDMSAWELAQSERYLKNLEEQHGGK